MAWLALEDLALIDLMTVQQWIETFGWSVEEVDPKTLRIVCPHLPDLPFFARCSENWLMLAIVPVLDRDGPRPADISRRLLAVNRDLRLAKFAYDDDDDIALTAELPTEALDLSELRDVVNRMAKYVDHYRGYLTDWAK